MMQVISEYYYPYGEAPTEENLQTKTKAKQRYLRRKKERRKNRNSKVPSTTGHKVLDEHEEDASEQESDASSGQDVWESEDALLEVETTKGSQNDMADDEKRSKKRRRISDSDRDVDMASPIPLQAEAPDARISANQKSLSIAAALPPFPILAVPDAPSKSDLALQGLDQALLDAEIVDPATSVLLSSEEGNDTMGLSEKMRKRLKDLAITELFAGMFFLMYSSKANAFRQDMHIHFFSANKTITMSPAIKPFAQVFVSSIRSSSRCMRVSPHRKRKDPCVRSTNHRSKFSV
jgi:hypothetical protein